MTSRDVILKSAELRGKRKFREAIDHVASQLDGFDPDILMNAYREMFLAAAEAGFVEEACGYARKLLELEPDLPSAKRYVATHCGGI